MYMYVSNLFAVMFMYVFGL